MSYNLCRVFYSVFFIAFMLFCAGVGYLACLCEYDDFSFSSCIFVFLGLIISWCLYTYFERMCYRICISSDFEK